MAASRQSHAGKNDSPITMRPHDGLGMVACLFVGGLVVAMAWFKLSSLDIGYHIAYGRHFLTTGKIVGFEPDPFLSPQTAQPFVNANWGSQAIMALADRFAGAAGLLAVRLGLIAIIFTFIAAVVRQHVSGWLAVAAVWLLASLGAYERFSMRPELFSDALLCGQLWLLSRGIRSRRSVLALVAMQLLWVNLHGYFLVGILLTTCWLVGSLLRGRWERRTSASDDPIHTTTRGIRLLTVALAAQIAVCFVNPWHIRGAVFPLSTLEFLQSHQAMGGGAEQPSQSAWSAISEFQSPFSFFDQIINHRTIEAYLVLLGVAGIGAILLAIGGDYAKALTIVLFFLMSIKMRRNIAQFALIAAPLSVTGYVKIIPWIRRHSPVGRLLNSSVAAFLIVLSSWWIVQINNGQFYYTERRVTREFGTGFSDRTFPRRALSWLADQGDLQTNLYVDYFSSSNTLLWLPERFKLFVDTNTFAYRDETLATAFKLGLGEIEANQFFDAHNINCVLLHGGPDTQMLIRDLAHDDDHWALVYVDPYDVIFIRRIMAHVNVIRQNRLAEDRLNAQQWLSDVSGPPAVRALALGTMVNVPMSLGWSRPAATLMKEATRLAPDYWEAWHYLGVCHGNMGNAAARDRHYADAAGQWKQAITCFREVLALHPEHPQAGRYLEQTQQRLTLLANQSAH